MFYPFLTNLAQSFFSVIIFHVSRSYTESLLSNLRWRLSSYHRRCDGQLMAQLVEWAQNPQSS